MIEIPTGLLIVPAVLQGFFIAIDEFIYHRRRGLPLWEKINHPIDSLHVLLCLGITLFFPLTPFFLWLYIGLAALSALLVTRDEFVHHKVCQPGEQWIHALLFVTHPLVLVATGFLWVRGEFIIIKVYALIVLLFFLYQILYWFLFSRALGPFHNS